MGPARRIAQRQESPPDRNLQSREALLQTPTSWPTAAACYTAGVSTTSYVSTIIELAAADNKDRDGLNTFEDPVGPTGGRVHVSIRMAPSAYTAVQAAAKRSGVSMNRFAAWAIARVVLG